MFRVEGLGNCILLPRSATCWSAVGGVPTDLRFNTMLNTNLDFSMCRKLVQSRLQKLSDMRASATSLFSRAPTTEVMPHEMLDMYTHLENVHVYA